MQNNKIFPKSDPPFHVLYVAFPTQPKPGWCVWFTEKIFKKCSTLAPAPSIKTENSFLMLTNRNLPKFTQTVPSVPILTTKPSKISPFFKKKKFFSKSVPFSHLPTSCPLTICNHVKWAVLVCLRWFESISDFFVGKKGYKWIILKKDQNGLVEFEFLLYFCGLKDF